MLEEKNSVGELIESLSLQVCMLEVGDIPGMGKIYQTVSQIEKSFPDCNCAAFADVIHGFAHYSDRLVLNETEDVKPLENGVLALQAIWRDISSGREFNFDVTDVLECFGCLSGGESGESGMTSKENDSIKAQPQKTELAVEAELSDDEIEILRDFIFEARGNLEVVELHLIELEKNPDEPESINAVFRSFHTIKGVSGFLKLDKMNRFCHHTESLMESARSGTMIINDEVVDIILESVDTLKLMLDEVEKSLETHMSASFKDIDEEKLIQKIQAVNTAEHKNTPIGKILVDSGVISEAKLRESLRIQKKDPQKKLGEILVRGKIVEAGTIKSALQAQTSGKKSVSFQVKVDTDKLDNLVDLTGELVIAQSMFRQIGQGMAINNPKYFHQLNQVTQSVSAIQKIAMSMRMVPIKNTFQKMFRLVRELTRNSGKEADLSLSGEETEIDRNVVDELYEPMVHMIRNSVDHGLESPSEREAAGKSKKGSIHLRAFQKGGNIIIEIEDDGKGLNRVSILEKALERKLINGEENLSDQEIYEFIMHPGFSTAKEITDISGRGVGMDVVKKSIEKLRGRLEIHSREGKGTVFTISLPLTMAIVEGMLVRVGKEKYIIPTHSIIESFRPDTKHCHTVEKKAEMVSHRENLIPLIRIDRLFNIKGDVTDPWEGIVVVAENHGTKKALLLDELLGKEEFVIKNLGETFQNIRGFAGSAILADGKVGLILDIAELFQVSDSYRWS
jgi:two-component system, chemotaxis family, sensor kinase CheA